MDLIRIAYRIYGQESSEGWINWNVWKFFHLSSKDLGQKAIFDPQIPDGVFDDMEEDSTTPRVCLAPTIEGCLLSLPSGGDFFIYGTQSHNFFHPKKSPFRMGEWDEYAEENNLDPDDEKAMIMALEKTVPDPETGEVWSLKPVTLYKIGKLSASSGELESIEWL